MKQISYIDSNALKNKLNRKGYIKDVELSPHQCYYGSRSKDKPIDVIYSIQDASEDYPNHHRLIPECLICDEHKSILVLDSHSLDEYKSIFRNSLIYSDHKLVYKDMSEVPTQENIDFSHFDMSLTDIV